MARYKWDKDLEEVVLVPSERQLSQMPQKGDPFFPHFEDEYHEGCDVLQILGVRTDFDDGGWEVVASDWVTYDCYWSERLQMWCYGLDND